MALMSAFADPSRPVNIQNFQIIDAIDFETIFLISFNPFDSTNNYINNLRDEDRQFLRRMLGALERVMERLDANVSITANQEEHLRRLEKAFGALQTETRDVRKAIVVIQTQCGD